MDTTIAAPVQHLRTELALHDDTELPPGFDPTRWPIIAKHVFGLAPGRRARPSTKRQPTLAIVSSRTIPPIDDDGTVDVDRLLWLAYAEATASYDNHRSVATKRCREASLAAWLFVSSTYAGGARP